MELTTTVSCRCRVSAGLDEAGQLTAKVFADAEYAPGRRTTAEIAQAEIAPSLVTNLHAALKAILEAVSKSPLLGRRIQAAIHKSAEVAAAHGEI